MGRKSTGSIRYRGDYQFRASVTVGGREKSDTFSSRQAAEDWIRGLLQANVEDQVIDELARRRTTLGEALTHYLVEITVGKKSAATEKRNIEAFLECEEERCKKALYEVRAGDLKALIKRRMKPTDPEIRAISGSTMNRTLTASKVFSSASRTAVRFCLR